VLSGIPAAIVGIDFGGTATTFVGTVDGEVITSSQRLSAELGQGSADDRVARVVQEIHQSLPTGHELAAVGIGATGPVDVETTEIENAATLPWFSGIGLVERLRRELGVAVTIDNDAVVAAIGEYGALAELPGRLLLVTLGTGVGGSLLIDGQPFRGPGGRHPEVGHLLVFENDAACYCGLSGCWEPRAARVALQAALLRELGPDASQRDALADGARHYSTSATVRGIFHRYGSDVGRGLAVLNTAYLPELIVIGGSAGAYLPLFAAGIDEAMTQQTAYATRVPIVQASLGTMAGAVGAASMASTYLDRAQQR
jgi:glucokinase